MDDIIHLLDRAESDIRLLCKLSPTSVSICTTNRMSGEDLSNKCFIKPTALNDHEESHFYNKCFQSNCMSGLYARWISINDSTDITLDSNCRTLLPIHLMLGSCSINQSSVFCSRHNKTLDSCGNNNCTSVVR